MIKVADIFDKFMSLINDPDLAIISEEDADQLLMNYLDMSITDFDNCRQTVTITEINSELFIEEDLSRDEVNILAYSMLLYWIEPKRRCWKTIENHTGTHDFGKLSNANVLLRLNDLQESTEKKLRRLRNAYQSKDMVGLG